MTLPSQRRFAGVLAHNSDQVVLVRESHERWGGEYWNVPSGMVEAHETPAEGAARELGEETGLVTSPHDLLLRTTTTVLIEGEEVRSWNFQVEVDDPALAVADPDALVREARWFPLHEAVDRLRLLPYRPLAEPAVATLLAGAVAPRTHWTFLGPEADPTIRRAT